MPREIASPPDAKRFVILAERVFDGAVMREHHVVIVDRALGAIVDVLPREEAPSSYPVVVLGPDSLVAPGFIDVQVNGGGGVLLNDEPTVEGLRTIAAAHRRFGTTGLTLTLISDTHAKMARVKAAATQAIAEAMPGILGVHFEGPFLSKARKGAHPAEMLRRPDEADVALLTAPWAGVTLVTLAPEEVAPETIARLSAAGVRVSAGHSDADIETINRAIAAGLTGFTHLFNATSQLQGRAPGVVGAALTAQTTYAGIIADGHHVHPDALRVAWKAIGPERLFLVTDSMQTVGSDITEFTLNGRLVRLEAGRLSLDDGTLAGAALDMATAVRNAVHSLGIRLEDALAMASLNPARFLGISPLRGRLAPGAAADMVALGPALDVLGTWIAGEWQSTLPSG